MGKRGLNLGSLAMAKFEQAKENPVKEGFLEKRGAKNKGWKKRYMTVKDSYLFYCLSKEDNPQGIINLSGCRAAPLTGSSDRKFSFTLLAPKAVSETTHINRTFFFCAANDEERKNWIDILEKCGTPPEEKKEMPEEKKKNDMMDDIKPSETMEDKEIKKKENMQEKKEQEEEMNEETDEMSPPEDSEKKKERKEKKEKREKKEKGERKEKKEKKDKSERKEKKEKKEKSERKEKKEKKDEE